MQTARALRARGVRVVAAMARQSHFVARSRAVDTVVALTDASGADLETLEDVARAEPLRPVLISCSDIYVAFIARHRVRLAESFDFVIPSDDVIELLTDKHRFYDDAASRGIAVPRSVRIDRVADLAQLGAGGVRYPVVIKPPSKAVEFDRIAGSKAVLAGDAETATDVVRRTIDAVDSLVAQEWIDGPESNLLSFNGYFDRQGRLQAAFVARKLRQWPPRTGTSAFGEEIRCDELLDIAVSYFPAHGYTGLAYLEMKRDERTGELVAVEPNVGRPTGRSGIAEGGGVALHYTAYADAAGLPLPDDGERTQRYTGVRWIYLRHDAQSAYQLIRRGELSVGGWLRSLRGRRVYAVWSARDPLPFLVDIWATVQKRRSRPAA